VSKSFEQYAAEYAKEPYPFPMPDGKPVLIPVPGLKKEAAAVAAGNASATLGEGLLAGLRIYAGEADGEKIDAAWGMLPSVALQEAVAEMRDYFGTKNS
jgi:hypothetical protein